MEKLTKAEAGYVAIPGTDLLCGDCIMLKPKGKAFGCAWFGPSQTVSKDAGGCNWFAPGDWEKAKLPWFSLFTKEELGYTENKLGFGCKRCEYIDIPAHKCEKVDEKSPGATPGEIRPATGCCSQWDPDTKRAKMTTPELMELIAKLSKPKLVQIRGQY